MDANIKTKWVEALRSGEYEQCLTGFLHDVREDTYCCLGVLCEVLIQNGVELTKADDELCTTYGLEGVGSDADLTDKIAEIAGLNPQQQIDLIDMNDAQGKNFPAIADYIELEIPVE